MSLPFIGLGSLVALGKESTWGTLVSTPNALPVLACTLDTSQEPMPLEYLGYRTDQVYGAIRDTAVVKHDAGGEIRTYASYDSPAFGLLLEACFGELVTTGASAPYTHALTLKHSGIMNGLSVQHVIGRSTGADTDKARFYVGAVVSSWELTVTAGEPVQLRATMIAKSGGSIVAAVGSPVVTSPEEVLAHHASGGGSFTWNAETLVFQSLRIRVDHKIDRRRAVGSLYTDVPAPTGFPEITITASAYLLDDGPIEALLAGSSGDLEIQFDGTGNNRLTITGFNCQLISAPVAADKPGVLMAEMTWRCRADTTNRGLRAVLRNDTSPLYS